MTKPFPNRSLPATLLVAMAFGAAAPAWAQGPDRVPPACWFYKYTWAYYRMVPNTAPPTPYAIGGAGTGMMVTEGNAPTPAETGAIAESIVKSLPRGDLAAPPPQAFIQSVSRVACPADIDRAGVAVAKIWLKQPEPLAAPAPSPRGK